LRGRPLPVEADRVLAPRLAAAGRGHVAAELEGAYHRVLYDRLLERATPEADALVEWLLREKTSRGWTNVRGWPELYVYYDEAGVTRFRSSRASAIQARG